MNNINNLRARVNKINGEYNFYKYSFFVIYLVAITMSMALLISEKKPTPIEIILVCAVVSGGLYFGFALKILTKAIHEIIHYIGEQEVKR